MAALNRVLVFLNNRTKHSARLRLALLCFVAVAYTAAYLGHRNLPGNTTDQPLGWLGWWDQSKYQDSLAAFAQCDLDAARHWYPVGYPLLCLPGYIVSPNHAFFYTNLAFVLLATFALWKIARLSLTQRASAICLSMFGVAHMGLLLDSFVIPWNTIPTAALLYLAILLCLKMKRAAALRIAFIAGVAFLIRPADAVPFIPLIAGCLLGSESIKNAVSGGILCGAILLSAWLTAGWIDIAIHGSWISAYEEHSAKIGFWGYPLSYKAFWLLLDSSPVFEEPQQGLLFRYPWLWLVVPALLMWMKRWGLAGAAVISCIVLSWLLYFLYNDFWPTNIYRFRLVHYISWSMPLLWVIVWQAIISDWKKPLFWIAAAVVITVGVGVSGLTLQAENIKPNKVYHLYEYAGNDSRIISLLTTSQTPYRDYFQFKRSDQNVILFDVKSISLQNEYSDTAIKGYTWLYQWSLSRMLALFKER
jgi:hypothetical protein